MSREVTIILDSGSLFPKKDKACEIGYFQCVKGKPDVTITEGGKPVECDELSKLGEGGSTIEIQHRRADGSINKDGISIPVPFHDHLLHMYDLYDCGADVTVDPKNFDYILRFECGEFGPKNVKERTFHRLSLASGVLSKEPLETRVKEVAHDLYMRFTLEDGESIVFTRDGADVWSTRSLSFPNAIEIKINADASTTEKFYRQCFDTEKQSYWMPMSPSPEDPPPWCPLPPCPDSP